MCSAGSVLLLYLMLCHNFCKANKFFRFCSLLTFGTFINTITEHIFLQVLLYANLRYVAHTSQSKCALQIMFYSYAYVWYVVKTITEQTYSAGSVLYLHLVCCQYRSRANVFCRLRSLHAFGTFYPH